MQEVEVASRHRFRVVNLGNRPLAQFVSSGKIGWEVELELMPDNEIDSGLLLQGFHSGLCVTACDGDEGVGGMLQGFPNQVARGPFRVFRHGAGVEHKEVGRLAELDQLEPLPSEPLPEDRGFGLIQAAAKRM